MNHASKTLSHHNDVKKSRSPDVQVPLVPAAMTDLLRRFDSDEQIRIMPSKILVLI